MEKINYDRIFEDTVKNLNGERKSLLLHSCCAPCSTAVLERVVEHFKVTVFFFNPNITESEEYYLRLNEQKRFLKERYDGSVPLIEGRYFSREFFIMTEGYEKENEGLVSLLQLDEEERWNLRFFDCGMINFMIPLDSLAELDFDDVSLKLQSL